MQTKKSKTKEKKETSIRDEIRGLGVIIEHVDDKVSLVAEQILDVRKTQDNHTKILNKHTEILDRHTEILSNHTEILDKHTEILANHTETLDNHTEMIGSMKMNIEIIKGDIAFIKGGLKEKVDIDEFSALERRVALLEGRR